MNHQQKMSFKSKILILSVLELPTELKSFTTKLSLNIEPDQNVLNLTILQSYNLTTVDKIFLACIFL